MPRRSTDLGTRGARAAFEDDELACSAAAAASAAKAASTHWTNSSKFTGSPSGAGQGANLRRALSSRSKTFSTSSIT